VWSPSFLMQSKYMVLLLYVGKGIPWFDEMGYCEDGAEDDAEAADDDVRDAEEGILAAHDGAGGYDDGLCAAVFCDGEVWMG
jgi:hypothetical protein